MKVKDAAMQAFPFIEPEKDDNIKAYHPGMTMRDEFAKAALPVVYADYCDSANTIGFEEGWRNGVAIDAYAMADAMLCARKTK